MNPDCNSYNVVYAKVCKKDTCKQVNLGETKRHPKTRFAEHPGHVGNNDTAATGPHFNSQGHVIADLSISTIVHVNKKNLLYRKKEKNYILEDSTPIMFQPILQQALVSTIFV